VAGKEQATCLDLGVAVGVAARASKLNVAERYDARECVEDVVRLVGSEPDHLEAVHQLLVGDREAAAARSVHRVAARSLVPHQVRVVVDVTALVLG
jgi:hypothetical protein